MFSNAEKETIKETLRETPGTVFIGCDSLKTGKRQARYTVVFVLHKNDSQGCKIFGCSVTEMDYDLHKNKPKMRLMNEVYKAVETYLEFAELLEDRKVEIHLDVNSDPTHNSNIVFNEAFGYVLGMTGLKPKMKPDAFIATHCADHVVRRKSGFKEVA